MQFEVYIVIRYYYTIFLYIYCCIDGQSSYEYKGVVHAPILLDFKLIGSSHEDELSKDIAYKF